MKKWMKSQQEIDAGNQFHSFMQGWRHGASSKAMDPKFTEHSNQLIKAAYEAGYGRARTDINLVAQSAAEAYGYTISYLRLMDEDHGQARADDLS